AREAPPSQSLAAARQAPAGPRAPADPQAAAGSSRATGAVSPPGLLDGVRNPEPEYPLLNRQRGDQGVVTVLLRISQTGQVTEVDVVATSGHPALDDSARRTVQRWRFRPATRDGVPIAGSIRTSVHFRLR
ncbi:energy transducer TonB, partial [Craurococcus roseus]|uniref:energy transducer TonB n=1 Tax=Craurococcus roseus TaxID=77585 RepID=UPI0031D65156